MKKAINHYDWLHKNFEKFCKNANFKYFPGAIGAHGDKLSNLKYECEKRNLLFYKISAIGLILFMNEEFENFEENCIKLYIEHPEWFDGCGDENAVMEAKK